jgi:tripartite-type tricarboxylate transporter receptor subunit TctC
LPAPLIQRVHAEITTALGSKEVADKLTAEGAEVVASTPQQFRDFIRGDIAKWAKVVKAAGMKLD